jgi:hypothetical protein
LHIGLINLSPLIRGRANRNNRRMKRIVNVDKISVTTTGRRRLRRSRMHVQMVLRDFFALGKAQNSPKQLQRGGVVYEYA